MTPRWARWKRQNEMRERKSRRYTHQFLNRWLVLLRKQGVKDVSLRATPPRWTPWVGEEPLYPDHERART